MKNEFCAYEILQIASRIERNVEAFYRKKARLTKDHHVSEKLLELADWQRQQRQNLSKMKCSLIDEHQKTGFGTFVTSPKAEKVRELGRSVITPEQAPKKDIKNVQQVLELAIANEREALCFYWGFKDKLWGKARDTLENIIQAKNNRIHILQESIERRQSCSTEQQEQQDDEITFDQCDEIEEL